MPITYGDPLSSTAAIYRCCERKSAGIVSGGCGRRRRSPRRRLNQDVDRAVALRRAPSTKESGAGDQTAALAPRSTGDLIRSQLEGVLQTGDPQQRPPDCRNTRKSHFPPGYRYFAAGACRQRRDSRRRPVSLLRSACRWASLALANLFNHPLMILSKATAQRWPPLLRGD